LARARAEAEVDERAQVARRVRTLLERSGLSRRAFAERVGTSPSRSSTYLNGRVAPSSTLMVRGLATGDVSGRDWGKLLGKEIMVAGALGVTMAAAVMLVGFLRAGPDIALVVASTMVIVVLVGSLVGMGLPFVLNILKFDPATASTPLITTIADVSGGWGDNRQWCHWRSAERRWRLFRLLLFA